MCGIAGFAGLSNEALLREMTNSLVHRGPDESGFLHKDGVGLGSRRLSIIDLAGGTQPIFGEKGDAVVFNGEIYNFKELREQLIRKGHQFKTHADTEVIIHLYEDKGIEGLKDLSGMFAVAIWDSKARKLILARDPVGVKPLYYCAVGDRIYFGSEMKALRKVPEVSSEIDLPALDHYFNYLYIPAPQTIYRGVSKLLPGEWLAWQSGKIQRGRFWEPRANPIAISPAEALERLDRLMAKVVDDQKVSDVPIGLFLSGGLDSSAVACYAAQSGTTPDAFVAYYSTGGESFDERGKAALVARHLGLKLHELCIEPKVPDVMEQMVQMFDEPMADSSALPNFWISRLIRKNVKVALTGVGGDELLGGYPRYAGARLLESYQKTPAALRALLKSVTPLIPEQVSARNIGSWARRFISYGDKPPEEAYAQWMAHLSDDQREHLYSRGFLKATGTGGRNSAPLAAFNGTTGDSLQKILCVDLRTYLPDDLLTLADRASMAASLEVRVPLCDQRLVEFALSLPSDLRVRGRQLKYLFKELLKDKLPPEILAQKKQGFMVPIGNWFKDDLRGFMLHAVARLGRRGLLRPEGIDHLVQEHLLGRRNRTDSLWSFVLLEHWFEKYHPDFRLDRTKVRVKGNGRRRIMVISDFIFPDDEGGSARVAWESAKTLKALGFDVLVCTLGRKDDLKYSENIQGLEVRRLWRKRFHKGMFLRPKFITIIHEELANVLNEFQPEAVFSHHLLIAWLLRGHPKLKRVPFSYFYHSSWPEEFKADNRWGVRTLTGRWMRAFLERRVLRGMKSFAVISDYMRRDLVGRYRFAEGKVTKVPSGIDLDRFVLRSKQEARDQLGLGDGPILVTIRNLRARMGLDILLEAAALLIPRHQDLQILIGGVGPLNAELQELAVKLGLKHNVRFLGRVADADLPAYYQAADLFVLPTRELEGFGLVLLEALACGTPCVGTPVGGIPEVLRPVDSKLLSDSLSPRSLAEAIERGLHCGKSPEMLRDYVVKNYGWDKMAQALGEIL